MERIAEQTIHSPAAPMKPTSIDLSVVVPVFNEAARLPGVRTAFLGLASEQTRLIFVDDGSTDDSPSILQELSDSSPHISVVTAERNAGKGAAVASGVAAADTFGVVFMDADLATDLSCLETVRTLLATRDVVIGSRALPGTVLHGTSWKRSLAGGVFNSLVRMTTGLPYRDTQCGLKGFRTHVATLLFGLPVSDGFVFDVDVLQRADAFGFDVEELPVEWTERPGSSVSLTSHGLEMGMDLLRRRIRGVQPTGYLVALRVQHPPEDAMAVRRALGEYCGYGHSVVTAPDETHLFMPHRASRDLEPLTDAFTGCSAGKAQVVALSEREVIQLVRKASRFESGSTLPADVGDAP